MYMCCTCQVHCEDRFHLLRCLQTRFVLLSLVDYRKECPFILLHHGLSNYSTYIEGLHVILSTHTHTLFYTRQIQMNWKSGRGDRLSIIYGRRSSGIPKYPHLAGARGDNWARYPKNPNYGHEKNSSLRCVLQVVPEKKGSHSDGNGALVQD